MRFRSVLCVLVIAAAYVPFFGQAVPSAPRGTTAVQLQAPKLSEEEIRALIRRAAEKDIQNAKAERNYTYIQREEEHKLDGGGKTKSTESRTYEIMVLFEEPVRKQIAKNDQPLPAKDAAKEDQKVQKIIDKRKKENEGDRRKRLEREEKDLEEGRKFVREIADAYNFQLVNVVLVNGRETYMIDAAPRPDYAPHIKNAKFLPKFRFRVWIDKQEEQWTQIDVQCIDTVSVGLFLVRLHKGSNIQIELTRINDEVWLPKHVALKINARIALLKGLNMSEDVTYRDYRKFRTDAKIVGVSAVEEKR